jgi:hypothetical protein
VGVPTTFILGYAETHWFDPAKRQDYHCSFLFLELSTQGCFCCSGYFGTHRIVLARVNAHKNSYRNTASDGALISNGEVIAAEIAHYVEESRGMIERVGERLRRCKKWGAGPVH